MVRRYLSITLLTTFSFLLCQYTHRAVPKTESSELSDFSSIHTLIDVDHALSLKNLQKNLQDCQKSKKCSEDVVQFGGLTQVQGYVLDPGNLDIIIIGKKNDNEPPLYTEDFVIALRNAWYKYSKTEGNTRYYSYPAVSIDPDASVIQELQNTGHEKLDRWRRLCNSPQSVRVKGIPFNSHFADVMVQADYDMKRIVSGPDNQNITGLLSLTDKSLLQVHDEIRQGRQKFAISSMNRFWFSPGENRYQENDGIVLINQSPVRLLTEEQFLNHKGEIAGQDKSSTLAQEFSEDFTDLYPRLAKRMPIYQELEDLFRFVALSKIFEFKQTLSHSGLKLDYLLEGYEVPELRVDPQVSGYFYVDGFSQQSASGNQIFEVKLPSCGGVGIDLKVSNENFIRGSNNINNLRDQVISSRHDVDSISWKLDFGEKLIFSKVNDSISQFSESEQKDVTKKFLEIYQKENLKSRPSWETSIKINNEKNLRIKKNNEQLILSVEVGRRIQIRDKNVKENIKALITDIFEEHVLSEENIVSALEDRIFYRWQELENGTSEIVFMNDYDHKFETAILDGIQAFQLSTNSAAVTIFQGIDNDVYIQRTGKNQKAERIKVDSKKIKKFWRRLLSNLSEILPLFPNLETLFLDSKSTLELINENPKAFGKILKHTIGETGKEGIIVLDRGIIQLEYDSLFPNNHVFRLGSNYTAAIGNIKTAIDTLNSKVLQEEVKIFEGIPQNKIEFENLQILADGYIGSWANGWQNLKWELRDNKNSPVPIKKISSVDSIRNALENNKFVIFVGHSDGENIYLSKNEKEFIKLSREQIRAMASEKIRMNKPTILLVNCQAGGIGSPVEEGEWGSGYLPNSLAQEFLKIGASLVFASDQYLSGQDSLDFLDNFIINLLKQTQVGNAFKDAINRTNQNRRLKDRILLDKFVENFYKKLEKLYHG